MEKIIKRLDSITRLLILVLISPVLLLVIVGLYMLAFIVSLVMFITLKKDPFIMIKSLNMIFLMAIEDIVQGEG